METKELKITIPEGFEIDKENSSFENIVFKKKDTKPRSWEEYCDNYTGKVFYIDKYSTICGGSYVQGSLSVGADKNTLPSKELAEAFLAMMQLMSLRQAWIGDWQPYWSKETSHKNPKYCIIPTVFEGFLVEVFYNNWMQTLSFPTREMAEDFMNTFKDLLNTARPLI